MVTKINLLRAGLVDNSTIVPIRYWLNSINSTSTESQLDLVLEFPFFNSSIFYDPDFSVTLATIDSQTDDSGSDRNLLPLLALIALIIPFTMLLLAAVVGGYLIWTKMIRRKAIFDALNIANQDL